MMQSILANWKTSAAGALVIVLGVAELAGIHIPGFAMDPGAAFTAGAGLLMAGLIVFIRIATVLSVHQSCRRPPSATLSM